MLDPMGPLAKALEFEVAVDVEMAVETEAVEAAGIDSAVGGGAVGSSDSAVG